MRWKVYNEFWKKKWKTFIATVVNAIEVICLQNVYKINFYFQKIVHQNTMGPIVSHKGF